MANANLFAQYLQPAKSIVDYQNDYAKADALKNQNAMQSLTLQQAASVQSQRNALRDLVQSGQIDLNDPNGLQKAVTVAPDVAPALAKTIQDQKTSAALAQKDTAQASNFTADAGKTTQATAIEAHNQQLQKLSTVNSPDDALAWMVDGVQNGSLPKQGLRQGIAALQAAAQDPTGAAFKQWKQQTASTGMTVQQQLQETSAKPTEVRLGNVVKTIDMNPNSQTFGKEVVAQQAVGVSPDSQLSADTQVKTTGMREAGENARSNAMIHKDLTVAGMNSDGTPSASMESMAQAIASGQLAPPSGFAAARPGAQVLMARVMQINPTYDATTYGAKVAAAKGFTTGKQGDALRSISTANEHLNQLDQLGDALNNGNVPIINQIGNAFGVQTGAPAPQVFNAVKNVVSQEVVKAIVAGGGSAGEREAAATAFNNASSPAQLKQTIAAYRSVMAAQQKNLLAQRSAAGLPNSTAPGYAGGGAAPAGGATPTVSNW